MRNMLVRGAMIAFVSAMGFFGSGASVQFDGLTPSVSTRSAEARMKADTIVCGDPYDFRECDGNGPDPWGIGG